MFKSFIDISTLWSEWWNVDIVNDTTFIVCQTFEIERFWIAEWNDGLNSVGESYDGYIDFFFAYHVMKIISYIILIMLRNINITVPRFYDVNHGKFIILICLDLFLCDKTFGKIFCREVCEATLVKTLITVLTPISWSYFVTRASTYDLIPCHTSGEHEQTSIMTTTSRSHFGGGSSLQSQVQSWFLISAVHSSSGGQYGGSAGSKERWLRWNWGEICVGMKWG